MRIMSRPKVGLTIQEIDALEKSPATWAYYEEKCDHWLLFFEEDYCLNVDNHAFNGWVPDTGDFDSSAWCYVSKECQDLNGGRVIADKVSATGEAIERHVSAKLCRSGVDRLLRDASPEELQALVGGIRRAQPQRSQMLSLGLVALEAYRALHPAAGFWSSISKSWRKEARHNLPEPLQEAMKRKEPMVVYTEEDHDHYKIILGDEVLTLRDERKRWFFGLLRTSERICPDTVHCLSRTSRTDEL